MDCYVSSRENRFYAAVEQEFGFAASISEENRIPAVRLAARQQLERADRRDKTGSRTFVGLPAGMRKNTTFELNTYMTSWPGSLAAPSYGPLFQAGLGGLPLTFSGGVMQSITGNQLTLVDPHGLTAGQGVSCGGEIRFVTAVVDDRTVLLNAPLTADQQSGWPVDPTVTYRPSSTLPSASIYDYWDPGTAVHRALIGAAVNEVRIAINGDFHEFIFTGMAKDLIDSASFESGEGGLPEFPGEPAPGEFDYSIVPGNLGQAWLGNAPDQFFTITSADVSLNNGLDLRTREFGLTGARCVVAGERKVTADFNLYARPDAQTKSLYQAARQRSPLSVMFQLGQQTSQLCGVYLKSAVPEVPEFLDDENRLAWRFRECRAQGTLDDEIFVAFG